MKVPNDPGGILYQKLKCLPMTTAQICFMVTTCTTDIDDEDEEEDADCYDDDDSGNEES